jgi:hypothetical protein
VVVGLTLSGGGLRDFVQDAGLGRALRAALATIVGSAGAAVYVKLVVEFPSGALFVVDRSHSMNADVQVALRRLAANRRPGVSSEGQDGAAEHEGGGEAQTGARVLQASSSTGVLVSVTIDTSHPSMPPASASTLANISAVVAASLADPATVQASFGPFLALWCTDTGQAAASPGALLALRSIRLPDAQPPPSGTPASASGLVVNPVAAVVSIVVLAAVAVAAFAALLVLRGRRIPAATAASAMGGPAGARQVPAAPPLILAGGSGKAGGFAGARTGNPQKVGPGATRRGGIAALGVPLPVLRAGVGATGPGGAAAASSASPVAFLRHVHKGAASLKSPRAAFGPVSSGARGQGPAARREADSSFQTANPLLSTAGR